MSIRIYLDANKLASAIGAKANIFPYFMNGLIATGGHGPNEVAMAIAGGWFFLRTLGPHFPAIAYEPVPWIGQLADTDMVRLEAIVGIIDVTSFYLFFTEITKAEYATYTGIDLSSDGRLSFVSIPENINSQIASGVASGNVLLLRIDVYKDGASWKAFPQVYKWDDTNKTFTRIDNQSSFTLTQTYRRKTVFTCEPKGVQARIALFGVGRQVLTKPTYYPPMSISDVFYNYRVHLGMPLHTEVNPW